MRLIHYSDASSETPTDDIRNMVEAVSENSLREWVRHIAIPRNMQVQPENNRAIASWLSTRFSEWGYEVQRAGPLNNILALPRQRRTPLLLVGAHYDSVPQTPGADDNASAVAAVLACAQVLARFAPAAPVCFVAFNGEENDLAGSKDFVGNFLPQADFQVRHAHILEMVGFATAQPGSQNTPTGLPISIPDTGDFLGLLANHGSGSMLEFILAQTSTYLPGFKTLGLEVPLGIERVFPVLARSDHVPFWNHGVPAVMWTDTSEFRNPNYHRASDTPETLDYAFLRNVTRLLVACVARQAFP